MMNHERNRSLLLQAYDGTDIPNSIDPDPSPKYIDAAMPDRLLLASVQILQPPTGRYNCHGLVFASRRTNIPPAGLPDAVDIDSLLRSDGYEPTAPPPKIGDIVVYRGPAGEIEHTGFVVHIETIGRVSKAFVWSKWGALMEVQHREDLSPYEDCKIEYWRLKI